MDPGDPGHTVPGPQPGETREVEGMEPHPIWHGGAPVHHLQLPSVPLSDAGALSPGA